MKKAFKDNGITKIEINNTRLRVTMTFESSTPFTWHLQGNSIINGIWLGYTGRSVYLRMFPSTRLSSSPVVSNGCAAEAFGIIVMYNLMLLLYLECIRNLLQRTKMEFGRQTNAMD